MPADFQAEIGMNAKTLAATKMMAQVKMVRTRSSFIAVWLVGKRKGENGV
jgi:hypothetical protein